MLLPLSRARGLAAPILLLTLTAACAGARPGTPGGTARAAPEPAAAGPRGGEAPAREPAGFAPGDLPAQLEREAELGRAIDAGAGARGLEAAAGRDGSGAELPAAAASLLAAFEESGLDAGAWPYGQAGQGGVNVLARIEGSDLPGEIVLLSARYPPRAGRRAARSRAAAVLAAAAGGLAALAESGWQPRRTIMLAAWDGTAAPAGARAWLDRGPLDVPATTLAALTVVERRDGSPAAATPALRPLVAGVLPAGGAPGDLEPDQESGLLLARGVPLIEVAAAPDADPDRVAAAASLLARLALRLADAPLAPVSPAATAQRALSASRELDEAARTAFADNPPPLRELRLALLEMRDAGEAWSRAGEEALARLGRVPRGRPESAAAARLAAASGAARAAIRLPDPSPREPGGCSSLLICPGQEGGTALLLPGLARVMAAGDRDGVVAQALVLAAAARDSAGRLSQAADMLSATPEESP